MTEQKTFKVTEEITVIPSTWQAGKLCVFYANGLWRLYLTHEKDIPAHWPDDLKRHCRAEILKHRELAENQARDEDGDVWTLEWRDGTPRYNVSYGSHWNDWEFGEGDESLRGPMTRAGDAWFRKHCPADRFVTDDGRVLRFEMNDEGESIARDQSNHAHVWTIRSGGVCFNIFTTKKSLADAIEPALYAFRDAERAKWRFEHKRTDGDIGPYVQVFRGEESVGWWSRLGWSRPGNSTTPQWVRTRAETMWKERNPEWSVRWNATGGWCGNSGAVEILKNGKCVASYFATPSLFPDRCPLDTQAEAVRVWDENNPKGKAKEKVVFKANGFKLARSIDEPDSLQLIDPQISQSEVEKFHSFPRRALKITIEPLGDE